MVGSAQRGGGQINQGKKAFGHLYFMLFCLGVGIICISIMRFSPDYRIDEERVTLSILLFLLGLHLSVVVLVGWR